MNTMSSQQWYRTLGAIGVVAIVTAGCASAPKPTEQIAVSNSAITNASRAGGNEYAPIEMRNAQDKMDRANKAMAREDYDEARVLAEQAQVDARLAEKKAESAKAQKAVAMMNEDIRVLREEINRNSR